MSPETEKRLLDFMDLQHGINERLTTLIEPIFDNGQPGLLTKQNNRIVALEQEMHMRTGMEKAVKVLWVVVAGLAAALGIHLKGH